MSSTTTTPKRVRRAKNLYQRTADGRFEARFTRRHDGKTHTSNLEARTLTAAKRELQDLMSRERRGEVAPPTDQRFADVAEDWLVSKHRLRGWTRSQYRSALDNVLLPRFGRRKLTDLGVSEIATLIRDLETKGLSAVDPDRPVRPLSASTITNYLKPLHGTLALAVRRGMIPANPCLNLTSDERPQSGERRPPYEWSQEEIDALLAAADDRADTETKITYALLLRTAVQTGLRLGELLGLQYGDLDLEQGVLHVRRQFTRLAELTSPKTRKGTRRVPLSADMVARLRRHRLASRFSTETDFVFASRDGTALSHRNVQRRAWEPARGAAGLPATLRFHDLRHAFASIAASRGVPVGVLSEVLGHSNVGVTQGVYVHMFDRVQAEDAFREAMSGN